MKQGVLSLLLFMFGLIAPICCDIPLDGPDPEVDEHIQQHFQGHMDAFLAGMKDELGEIKKESEEKAAKGEDESGNLANLLKPETVVQFISNWLPERLRALLPKDWLIKLLKALTSEAGAIAEFYANAERIGSSKDFWHQLRKKTPQTAELLEDAWAQLKMRWDQFNGRLNDESKQYMDKVQSSGWEWFVRQVAGPFLRLPNDVKTNLTLSLFEAYPLLNTVMSKVMTNRTLLEWAGEWYKNSEEQIRTMEKEKSATKEEFSEENMMAQMKEMFKRMNLGEFDDLMGGMDEEGEKEQAWEEEEKREGEEEATDEEETVGEEETEEEGKTAVGRKEEKEKGEEKEEEGGQCSKGEEEEGQCVPQESADSEDKSEKSTEAEEEERDEL